MVIAVFAFIGTVAVLGFIGNLLFTRTGIPDVLVLVLLGVLVGPVLHLADPSTLAPVAPLFATVALVVILFEGALHLKLYAVLEGSPRALLLAVAGFLVSVGICAATVFYLLHWSLGEALLIGTVLGASGSSVVIPLISRTNAPDRIVTLLTLESAFADAIVIVATISLLQIITATGPVNPVPAVAQSLASRFSIGIVFGLLGGVSWTRLLINLAGQKYVDILTLCVVLLLYAATEEVGGSGAMSVLAFGLALANGHEILRMFRVRLPAQQEALPVHFMSELSFFVRTFFFVYLGFITSTEDLAFAFVGLFVAVLLLIGRFVASVLSSVGNAEMRDNLAAITFMLPRGLAAAVMARVAGDAGIAHGAALVSLVIIVILGTVGLAALGNLYLMRHYRPIGPETAPPASTDAPPQTR